MTAPKSPIKAVTKVSSMIRNRRGATISASAPAGTVHRNIGSVLAICTSETALGSGFRLVISQAEAVSEIASPVNEQVVATHITANGVWEKAPRREYGESIALVVNRHAPLRWRDFIERENLHKTWGSQRRLARPRRLAGRRGRAQFELPKPPRTGNVSCATRGQPKRHAVSEPVVRCAAPSLIGRNSQEKS